ncbi:MAG: outer membrane beta-barrel protein [Tannerella sp.]|nr:outer membrane beta-barrel protein [Tannerella sp.]
MAQEKFSISGAVSDEQDEALVSATVVLKRGDSIVSGAVTGVDGRFAVDGVAAGGYDLHVSYVGFESYAEALTVDGNLSLDGIVLKELSLELGEAVVTGRRRQLQMEEGLAVATIANTPLARETNVTDVLRKMPGMTVSDGELKTFTGGTPLIYINGRRVQSMREVEQLSVKEIKTVTVDMNPGSRYDAATDAVLLITTHRKTGGWSMQVDADGSRNHRTSHSEAVKVNYNSGGLNVFASAGHDDSRRRTLQLMRTVITTADTVWTQRNKLTGEQHTSRELSTSLGVDYMFGEDRSVGIKYDGVRETFYNRSPNETDLLANSRPLTVVTGELSLSNKDYTHQLNAYYRWRFSERVDMNVYADYANMAKGRDLSSDESSSEYGDATVSSRNESDYTLYAVSSKLNVSLNAHNRFSTGMDWSYVDGRSTLVYAGGMAHDMNSASAERKLAGYASWSYNRKPLSVSAGVRYEHVRYRYDDFLNAPDNIRRSYSDLFPNITLSHAGRAVSQSLSYRIATARPNFNLLSNNSTYMNRFMYQTGNPKLQPQTAHRIQYTAMYRFVYLALGYVYNRNYIGSYFYTPAEDPSMLIYSWQNFDRQQQLNATLNMQYRLKNYEPSLTAMFMKNIQQVTVLGGTRTVDKPLYIVRMNNAVHLPADALLNVEYQYQSSGSMQIFTFKPAHVFNVTLSKSFANDALQINLQVNDVFGKNISIYEGDYANINFSQIENQDRRSVALHVVYRFNNYAKKYKGQNAAGDEAGRLK